MKKSLPVSYLFGYFRRIPKKTPRYRLRIPRSLAVAIDRRTFLLHKENARVLAERRIEYFVQSYPFRPSKVCIRNQKTRWGSCSKKGNINLNYKIALLPAHLADYVIVHELCHLGEFNHSQKFWALVEKAVPDHRARRKELMQYARNRFIGSHERSSLVGS